MDRCQSCLLKQTYLILVEKNYILLEPAAAVAGHILGITLASGLCQTQNSPM